jgi:hypothetical protein
MNTLTSSDAQKLFTEPERLSMLDRLVEMEPHALTWCMNPKFESGFSMYNLAEIITLAVSNKRWSIACYLANIMRHAGFHSDIYRQKGDELYKILINSVTSLPEAEFKVTIAEHPQLWTDGEKQLFSSATFEKRQKNKNLNLIENISALINQLSEEGAEVAFSQLQDFRSTSTNNINLIQ